MEITAYLKTFTKPSKLDLLLASVHPQDLAGDSKTKVCIITDIAKVNKALGHPPLTSEDFYRLYDNNVSMLEAIQHNLQVEYNTKKYHNGYKPLQGEDF